MNERADVTAPVGCRASCILPVVLWSCLAGVGGEASAGPPPSDERGVMPLVLPAPSDGAESAAARRAVYEAVQKQARYLLGQVRPWEDDPALSLITESRSAEHWIRPNAGTVEGLAFLLRFGPYDEKLVGRPRAELPETLFPMMRYLVATHVTGTRPTSDGKPWGDAWQSAHWAQMLGRAAWWVWGDLPEDLRAGVRRVVAHEAGRFVRARPPHQIRRDTKAEENAWNAQIFSVAMLLMPGDPRRTEWEAAFQRWAMSSFLRPADAECGKLVDGKPVSEQFTGANLYDDFTLENHGIIHPDYMQTFGLSLGCATDFRMTGREPPEAVLYNVAGVYENLKWFVLPGGGFVYPSGQDWRLFRNPDWLRSHALMAVFGRDPEAWELARRSLDCVVKMQARSDTGAVYLPGEYFFASTQPDMLRALANTWLVLHFAGELRREFEERLGVRRLEHGRIILHRTPAAVHTFSWGTTVMAQCVPKRLDRLVSPDQRNGVGTIRIEGGAGPLPVRAGEVEVIDRPGGFTARLVVDHGDAFRAELRYESQADGTWTVEEKLVALREVTTAEIATGLIGVLNNKTWIYEDGGRELTIDGKEHLVESLSGKVVTQPDARQIDVDGVLQIAGEEPLSIRYVSAARPVRARVTDHLSLNYLGDRHTWRAGQEVSRWKATLRCIPQGPKSPENGELQRSGNSQGRERALVLSRTWE